MRRRRGQPLLDLSQVGPHIRRPSFAHPHDMGIGADLVHGSLAGGAVPSCGRFAVHGDDQQQVGAIDAEGDEGAVRLAMTALRLISLSAVATRIWSWGSSSRLAARSRPSCPGGVDVGPVPDVEAGEFTDHDLSTRTPRIITVSSCLGQQDGRYEQRIPPVHARHGGDLPAAADAVGVQDHRRAGRHVVLNWRMAGARWPAIPGTENMFAATRGEDPTPRRCRDPRTARHSPRPARCRQRAAPWCQQYVLDEAGEKKKKPVVTLHVFQLAPPWAAGCIARWGWFGPSP